jgi:hypothetical protein
MIVTEQLGPEGPTGLWRRVILASIVDAGDNVLALVNDQEEVESFMKTHRGGPYYLRAVGLYEVIDPSPEDLPTGILGVGQAH